MEKKKFFYNKFLPVLSLFMLISFVFINYCSAYSVNYDYELPETDLFTNHVTGKDDNGYYIIEGQSTVCDRYFVISADGILYYFFVSDGYFNDGVTKYYFNNTSKGNYIYYEYYSDGSFKRQNSLRCDSSFNLWHYNFVYSTFDLTTENGTVFFQGPPQEVEEVMPTTLVGIMEKEQAELKTIQEILGILPLILVVVVSFLGLRKALNWLLTLLRRS